MKKYSQFIVAGLMVFAVGVSLLALPVTYAADTFGFDNDLDSGFGDDFEFDASFDAFDNESNFTFTECILTVDHDEVDYDGSVTLTWETTGFTDITLSDGVNEQVLTNHNGEIVVENVIEDVTYKLEALNDQGASCVSEVTVICIPPTTPDFCELDIDKSVDKTTAQVGDELTYTINFTNVGTGDCTNVVMTDVLDQWFEYQSFTYTSSFASGNGSYADGTNTFTFTTGTMVPHDTGSVTLVGSILAPAQCGDFTIPNRASVDAAEITTAVQSQQVTTNVTNPCSNPAPVCTLTPEVQFIDAGATTTLTWTTANADTVTLTSFNGVELNGERVVGPLPTETNYTLTATGPGGEVTCPAVVKINTDEPAPTCDLFNISPDVITAGGTSTITWATTNATYVAINNGIGEVDPTGEIQIAPTDDLTYQMTVIGTNNQQVTCDDKITVVPVTPVFSCANNVVFTASDYAINNGEDVLLSWTVTDADSVALDGSAVAATGNQSVSPSNDTTYNLTATKAGFTTISCPVSVDVSSGGGGGGGSARPRCELEISDTKITRGEEIEIEWETSAAREVTLIDDRDNVLFTTDDYLADDKEDYYDGSITLKPTRDTQYTLIAERGSRDDECEVEVEVEDDVVVIEDREQQPLVTGIALTQVPYTGFEAGPVLTALFYMLLIAWSLFITYLIVVRNKVVAPVEVFMTDRPSANAENIAQMKRAESVRSDVFTPSVAQSTAAVVDAPSNLPTAVPTIGYEAMAASEHQVTDELVTELENRAHAQKALLSSDAVRYFISTTEGSLERNDSLDQVISEAKKQYPLEDGWIVVNEARMRHLCDTCLTDNTASTDAPFIPATVPEGTGSLAEAIVTGNVVAAYEMIGSRPMFALADAAADLDAVYRSRKGADVQVSDMLQSETANLSDEQIKDMISALTSALDGTYTDEASAVKMAIMKAVKVVG